MAMGLLCLLVHSHLTFESELLFGCWHINWAIWNLNAVNQISRKSRIEFEFYIKSGMFIDTVWIPLQIHFRISMTEKNHTTNTDMFAASGI